MMGCDYWGSRTRLSPACTAAGLPGTSLGTETASNPLCITPLTRLPRCLDLTRCLISGEWLLFSLYHLSFLICKMGVIVTVNVPCMQDILCKWKWSTSTVSGSSERPLALGPTGLRLLEALYLASSDSNIHLTLTST